MRIFSRETPGSGDAEFRRWMEENPDGYFVNVTGSRAGRLHRGDCPHFEGCESLDLVAKPKWAADNRRELRESDDRARKEAIELVPCDTG